MPVFHFRRDINHITRVQLPGRFPPLLIITSSACDKQYLPALMMDMPIIATAFSPMGNTLNFSSDILNTLLFYHILTSFCAQIRCS